MSSPHLPGPHGFIIAAKMSLFLLLFCLGAQFFPTTQERNPSNSIQYPVQLLNNSLPLFNNLFVNQPNSFQLEPDSFQMILYHEPNSFQLKPDSFQMILYHEPNSFQLKPNSYQLVPYFKPNSYQLVPYFKPNSYQVVCEPNSYQLVSYQELYETTLLKKNTSEQTVLYLFLRLQNIFMDFENNTRENQTIYNNVERNIIMNQINSFLIFSI